MNVDELVVELSLDPAKFTKGQREAVDSFKKAQGEFQKGLKELDSTAKSTSYSFAGMTAATQGLATMLLGAGIVAFAKDAINAGANVGRLAQVTGVASQEMSAFGKMIQNNGGSAESASESLHGLARAMQNLKWGNFSEEFLKGYALLQQAEPTLSENSTPTQLAMALGKFADKHNAQEVEQVANWMGLSIDVVYEALRGSAAMAHDFDEGLKNALSPEQIARMQEAQRSINDMEQSLKALATTAVTAAAPGLKKLADELTPLIQNPLAKIRSDAQRDIEVAKKEGKFDPVSSALLWAVGPEAPSPSGSGGGTDAGASAGAFTSQKDKEAFIRASAIKAGINPDVAMAVARSEGFNNFKSTIPGEKSYGAFQLHVTPNGRGHAVGDEFHKLTGLDPSDPKNEHESIMFAMEWAKRHGWHDFHGAANTGIGNQQGIGDVHIDQIVVQTNATDAKGISRDIGSAVKRDLRASAVATQANTGLN